MERPKTVDIVTDAAMVLILLALGIFVAVAPAAVIAVGIPVTIGYRLITRSRPPKPHIADRDLHAAWQPRPCQPARAVTSTGSPSEPASNAGYRPPSARPTLTSRSKRQGETQ